jgi:hypothetical protein
LDAGEHRFSDIIGYKRKENEKYMEYVAEPDYNNGGNHHRVAGVVYGKHAVEVEI